MKISIINGMCVRHDAISEAVRGTFLALTSRTDVEARLFAYSCDYSDISFQQVSHCTDILMNGFFDQSDLIIYHFGIFYELFNTALLGNGRAPQVVRYHNVTPKEFLQPHQYSLVDKSLSQIANMSAATRIWADSSFNKQHLVEYGIDADRIDVSPLYVKDHFGSAEPNAKPVDRVRILYVGRFVRSKGVTDLIEAIAKVHAVTDAPFSVELAGNLSFSDPAYLASVQSLITQSGLDHIVQISGDLDDETLWQRFLDSHVFVMPSYHEGFCVPAIEALRAQCLPIAYASGNLPDLLHGAGEIVQTGDIAALGDRILRHVQFFAAQNKERDLDAMLPLHDGPVPLRDMETRMHQRVRQYSFAAFKDRLQTAVEALT